MPQVRVRGLVKTFRTRRGEVVALDRVSIDIARSERVVLLGPSGCGKTTLLRCVAGLEQPDAGEIEIDGQTVFSSERKIFVPPEARGISMMFQSYALWPHMTVASNVSFPLDNRGGSSAAVKRSKVDAALEMVACGGLQARYPAQLSGGQQQRVALARAVVAGDAMLLFDEPLSNVDAKVREQLRLELVTLQRKLGFAWLYVTHDQTEATAVADRIAVFRAGRIVQLGTPDEIYNYPNSIYVAGFVGASNAIEGRVDAVADGIASVDSPVGRLRVHSASAVPGQAVLMMFRPEQIDIDVLRAGGEPAVNRIDGRLDATMFLGSCTEYAVRVGERQLVARRLQPVPVRADDPVSLRIAPEDIRLFPAESATR
ncbi:MAG: ABC transporter ATP-binding protein [Lautropia sp.]